MRTGAVGFSRTVCSVTSAQAQESLHLPLQKLVPELRQLHKVHLMVLHPLTAGTPQAHIAGALVRPLEPPHDFQQLQDLRG